MNKRTHAMLLNNLRRTVSSGDLSITALPDVPELLLYLLSADYPKGRLDHDEMLAIMSQPAYWSFCWASGQVLSKYLIDHPQIVAEKTVLDLGSGSGVVAIAAAKAGAKTVIACDNDPLALDATRANAELNEVDLTLSDDLFTAEKVDLILAADVLYDRDNLELLTLLPERCDAVVIADSRVRDEMVFTDYEKWVTVTSSTLPDLDELKEYGEVSLYYRAYR